MNPLGIEVAVIALACSATAALMLWLWRDGRSAGRDVGAVIFALALAAGGMLVLALVNTSWSIYAGSGLLAAALGFPLAALWRQLTTRR